MRRAFKITATVTVFLATIFALAFVAGANMGGFSASPNIPENQEPLTHNAMFDLWVTPGMQQEISFNVTNQRDEPITVEINLFTAGTNMNGVLDYFEESLSDDSIPFRFEDIASLPPGANNLTIPAQTTETIPLILNIPADGFEGMTLGSINVLLGVTDQERAQAGAIVNRFASNIPVRLRIEGTSNVEPDFYLGEITAEVVAHRAAMVARIHHTAPRMSVEAMTNTWIYQVGSDQPSFTLENRIASFAPNTIFPATMLDLQGQGIQPGNYVARVQIEYGGRVWDFEREFTVAPQVAQAVNEGAFNQQHQMPVAVDNAADGLSTTTIVLIAAAVLLLILAVTMLLILRKRNKPELLEWSQLQPDNTKATPNNTSQKKSEAEIIKLLERVQASNSDKNN